MGTPNLREWAEEPAYPDTVEHGAACERMMRIDVTHSGGVSRGPYCGEGVGQSA